MIFMIKVNVRLTTAAGKIRIFDTIDDFLEEAEFWWSAGDFDYDIREEIQFLYSKCIDINNDYVDYKIECGYRKYGMYIELYNVV